MHVHLHFSLLAYSFFIYVYKFSLFMVILHRMRSSFSFSVVLSYLKPTYWMSRSKLEVKFNFCFSHLSFKCVLSNHLLSNHPEIPQNLRNISEFSAHPHLLTQCVSHTHERGTVKSNVQISVVPNLDLWDCSGKGVWHDRIIMFSSFSPLLLVSWSKSDKRKHREGGVRTLCFHQRGVESL